jgi:START-like superfamily domain
MEKTIVTIEYELKKTPLPILWDLISTPQGLSDWFANKVTQKETQFVFSWKDNTQTATLLASKVNSFVKFQWQDDYDTNYYFELKIVRQLLSKNVGLIVTDFAAENEVEDTTLLWDKEIEALKKKIGIS